jgi:hypothetical protein
MTRALLFGVAVGLLVGGCAAFEDAWTAWFGASPSPTPIAAVPRDVFYAGAEGLPLYELPTASSPVIARLTLHQRVTRLGMSRGYANVATEAGLSGWVDNADLLWRLPGTPAAPAATMGVAAAPAPAPAAAETPLAPAVVPTAPVVATPATAPGDLAAEPATPTAAPAPTLTSWSWRTLLRLPRR